ncbi:LuxR family transcriptional regulator [Novosphingobium sp.]|uniref:helix-turn-helix transcriptional regulator n=1 Tax=Novosphingobium sp. TaxID=1874826 RepID=UPI002603B3F9|nr:LuxR family transcriptional regulator [Novosphingobium sp.]
MAFLSTDQRELYLPLMEGLLEDPPWQRFLANLLQRTGARRAALALAPPGSGEPTLTVRADAARAALDPPLDLARLAALGLFPGSAMRTGRVYTLGEMLDFDAPTRLSAQRSALGAMRINHARAVRIGSPGGGEAWLLLTREREDLGAADSALLAALAPHLAAALGVRAALGRAAMRVAMAESTLALLSVGEVALTASGAVLAADPEAERQLTFTADPGPLRRLQLLPETARALETACAQLSGAPLEARRLVLLGARHLLLCPAPAGSGAAAIGIIRSAPPAVPANAAAVLAATHGLSAREAALAIGLASGETILEAGSRLGLTPETARNYSKRLYAKTGTSGQAQLVALVLTGLAPLA